MNKRSAFVIAFGLTIILFINYNFLLDINFGSKEFYYEKVNISKIIDGDTLQLDDNRIIRLLNINTPEKNELGYIEALNFLKYIENKEVYLEIVGTEKYGRALGRIYYDEYINLAIVKNGLGHIFLVNEEETDVFLAAQKEAFLRGVGIWNKSKYYGCLDAEIDKKNEFVVIYNKCGVNLTKWTIKDESTKKYTFKENPKQKFVLYSGKGKNNETAIYFGRNKVWNDDRDSIFIRDSDGFIVFYHSYGY